MGPSTLRDRYREARSGGHEVVLEGLHAIKHCRRFDGGPTCVVSPEPSRVQALAEELAPDIVEWLGRAMATVPAPLFQELCPRAPATPVAAIGPVRRADPGVVAVGGRTPLVFLEDPHHLGNVGAAIRVAAAADCGGLFTSGALDVWNHVAVRGSAGLHYALDVGSTGGLADTPRQVVALDPEGGALDLRSLRPDAILAFGTERQGLTDELRSRADLVCRLPMRAGVSSLNLATAVAATLFAWRLGSEQATAPSATGGPA